MVISMRDDRMINDNYYVYKKEVDWLVLQQGVSIPVTIQVVFQSTIDKFLSRGQSKHIYLVLEGKTYKARLVNQKFDERKYLNRKDILQIRYHLYYLICTRFVLMDIMIISKKWTRKKEKYG